ncbi:phosphoglycerate mutase family protein [Aspergillus undulatus]|uniref:phosphoglycerate mutase family protein n=1 Tax=Aspergillus undulatus TaxID=1810928 RepID=UPI003CCDD113
MADPNLNPDSTTTTTTTTTADPDSPSHFHFTTVPNIFLQSLDTTDPSTFDYTKIFGLISRSYPSDPDPDPNPTPNPATQWPRLTSYITHLNSTAPNKNTRYKLLILGRHGQGLHNVAESRYGTALWDCKYSLLDGDETGSWFDARLTEVGREQARTAHAAWKTQIERGIPVPRSFYVSPLMRCCETAWITFQGLGIGINGEGEGEFRPVVKELLRETLGLHICDARSPKSTIANAYPSYKFEDGFSEEDPLHKVDLRESDSARDARFYELLSDIWHTDEGSVISLTAHSGAITSILSVVGHRKFAVETGGVIPLLVCGEKRGGRGEERVVEPWFGRPLCPGEKSNEDE